MKPWERYAGGVAAEPQPEARKPWERYASSEAPVEQDVPRETTAVPRQPARTTVLRGKLEQALRDTNLFPSAADALNSAKDKRLERGEDGKWLAPLMSTTPDPDEGLLSEMGSGLTSALMSTAGRFGAQSTNLDPVIQGFQDREGYTDDEVKAAWEDLGAQNRTWEEGEETRLLSDGELLPNPTSSTWLDPTKAESVIAGSGASDEVKERALRSLPQLATNLAAEKLGAYEAGATASNAGRIAGSLIGLLPGRVVPPSEWAKEKGRDDIGSPQFILDYEKDADPGFLQGIAAKTVLSGNKVATQTLGAAGAIGLNEVKIPFTDTTIGELAAQGSEGGATVNRGIADTGIIGSVVEEALPIGTQILATRGIGAFGKGAAALGTFATAGAQSAGLTFAEEIAAGTPEAEAREKAAKAGLSTAIITSMFGTGAGGGVERLAVGAADDVTVGQLLQKMREEGVKAATPELRKFAGATLGATLGEGAEEGIDQLVSAFLTADPDTSLADAWEQALQAAKVGAVIGGGTHVAMNMVQNAPLSSAALTTELDDLTDEKGSEIPSDIDPGSPVAETPPTNDGVLPGVEKEAPAAGTEGAPVGDQGVPAEVAEGNSASDLSGALGGMGKAIGDNFRETINQSIAETGDVPAQESGSLLGQAWRMVKDQPDAAAKFAQVMDSLTEDSPAGWTEAIDGVFRNISNPVEPAVSEPGATANPASPEVAAAPEPGAAPVVAETGGDQAVGGAEPGVAESVDQSLKDLSTKWGKKNVRLDLSIADPSKPNDFAQGDAEGAIRLDYIKVPESERSKGVGSKAVDEIKTLADATGRPVELIPTTEDTGLPEFYEKRGFQRYERINPRSGRRMTDGFRYTPKAEATAPAPNETQDTLKVPENVSQVPPESNTSPEPVKKAPVSEPPAQDKPAETTYSRDRLKETFNLTDEQADATDALVQSMGLDTSKIHLQKGGKPGSGLRQEGSPEARNDLPTDQQVEPANEKPFDSSDLRSRLRPIEDASSVSATDYQDENSRRDGRLEGGFTALGNSETISVEDALLQKPSTPQGIKGSFELLPTGEALLRGLTNPDVSTAVHELSHVARKTLFNRDGEPVAGITDDDIEVVERWAGADGGNWSVAAEEKFARGFERYLRDGKAPTKGLQPVFDKIGNWLKGIYQTLKGSPVDVQMPPAVRAVFDRLVSRNAAPDASAQTEETSEDEEIPGDVPPVNPQGTSEPVTTPENLTSVKNEATDAELKNFGFDPIAVPAQQALDVSWERALARLERNPAAGQALVDELNTKPRATDDVEHGMLLKMLADAKVAYGRTQQDLVNAEMSGDLATIEEAHRQNDIARDAVFQIITAAKATGTVWGRAGRFRQLAIDEDYSLVQMEAKFRTEVNQGKALSKEQAAEVKRMQEEIAKAKQDLEDYKAKEAERMAEAVHAATLAAIKKAKPQIRKKLGSKIEEAKKRLQALGLVNPEAESEFLAQEALPPEVLEDLATVAAGWIVDGNPTEQQFADRLKRMFGEKVAGQADAIRARSREIIDATIEETFNPTTGDVEKKPRKAKTRESIVEDIDSTDGLSGNDVFQLARIHINAGVQGFENVMKAVQADLETVFPGITLREIHDAYSGYGRIAFPSKEEDQVKLREYRTLARLTSQLEDASKGLSPKRTGMQRDKASERVRTLQKQVRDMMRKMGINDVSDDQRLKTSLGAVKSRLRNEIEELEVAIRDRAPRPEGAKGVDYDAEANDLKAQRDKLKQEYQEIFGKRELTDDDRIRMTVKALERRIAEAEKLISEGKAKREREAKSSLTSPEIEALRAKLGGLNEQRNALRDRENERLERTKKMVRGRIEKIQDRIKREDYEPAKKLPPVKADEELGKLQREEIEAKRAFNEKLYEAQRKRRGTAAKAYDGVIDVFNASRSIITSADLSAVLRQGGFIVFGNPLRALKALPAMFKAGVSKDYAQALADEISRNSRFVQSQKAGLFLSEFGDTHHFSKMEEQFRGQLAKKIPGVGKVVEFSERTYTAFLNKLRMDTFEAMANSVSSTGDLTDGEAKVIANFINIATGRGNLERYDKAAEALAAAFFSPKYVASRFQLLAMPMSGFRAGQGASWRTRKAIATEYAKTALGVGSVYALVALSKAMLGDDGEDEKVSVETDPRSSDFGKVKIGNTRVDFLFGMLQATVFLSRMTTGEKKRANGEIISIRGEDAGFGESAAATMGTFLRTKLAPIPGTIVNLIDGKDVVGNKVYWETELAGNLMPLSMGDIYTTMKEQGVPAGTALGILSIFGAGAATYGEDVEGNLEQDVMTGVFQVDPKRYED